MSSNKHSVNLIGSICFNFQPLNYSFFRFTSISVLLSCGCSARCHSNEAMEIVQSMGSNKKYFTLNGQF
ncbi:hypothetical protein PIB30_013939 [Stylosanthes scabra]|uniref:Uncharacterized protein n=1 Tax=Stylosanthes scabra TaxID=79078 RepID=A0ABU6W4N4_9FABA|nr:hypothetical protein [Stylosanthes scabra]